MSSANGVDASKTIGTIVLLWIPCQRFDERTQLFCFIPNVCPHVSVFIRGFKQTMNTDLTYQCIMAAAILTGFLLSRQSQQRLKLPWQDRFGVFLGAFCGAMIGAKIPFLLYDWEGVLTGGAWFQNGKTILCGLAGGYLGVEIAKWMLGVQTRTGDSFAVPVAASVAIGRLGCFHIGCCYGTPTELPWGVVFPAIDALPRHPTQLYETAFHACAAIALWLLVREGHFRGNLIKLYIIAYANYRFFTEWIRPEPRMLSGLTAYQWASLAMIIIFAILWRRDAVRYPK